MRLDSFLRLAAVFVLTLVVFGTAPVWADTPMPQGPRPIEVPAISQPSPVAPKAEPQVSLPQEAVLDSNEVTILRDNYAGQYNLATLEQLSQLYWKLGAFDLEDDMAITNYIKINNCKVYTDFVNDDMEWRKIVDTMRGHLSKSKDAFPVNFQFVLELHLGRYDPARGGFPIVDRTGFTDAKRIELDSIDFNKETCFDTQPVKDYPKSVVILLPEAFNLNFVKLDEHVAQAYILRKKSEYAKLDEAVRVKRYERDAYLRLRVSFTQYNGNLRGEGSTVMAILFGTIDGYDIFEDSYQKRLMLSVDTKTDKTSQMSMPSDIAPQVAEQPPVEPAKPVAQLPADAMVIEPDNVQPVVHSFTQ